MKRRSYRAQNKADRTLWLATPTHCCFEVSPSDVTFTLNPSLKQSISHIAANCRIWLDS
jgi:hypothetical protein